MRFARRWNRCASSGSMPRWCSCDLRLRPRERRRALEDRRIAVLVGQVEHRLARRRDQRRERQRARCAPAARRTRRRRLKIGSSTAPAVFESGRPSITDIGVRTPRPRPRKRARSVSYCAPLDGLALDDDDVRRPDRRVVAARAAGASRAARSTSGTNSVCTNRFEKAGCAASAAGGASTTSA